MTRLISWLIMIPLAVAVVVFTVANRALVTVDLWPMPVAIDIPVFMLVLVGGFTGFLVGALIVWLSGGRRRLLNRQLVRQLEASRREQTELQKRIERLETSHQASPTTLIPAPDPSRADAA